MKDTERCLFKQYMQIDILNTLLQLYSLIIFKYQQPHLQLISSKHKTPTEVLTYQYNYILEFFMPILIKTKFMNGRLMRKSFVINSLLGKKTYKAGLSTAVCMPSERHRITSDLLCVLERSKSVLSLAIFLFVFTCKP